MNIVRIINEPVPSNTYIVYQEGSGSCVVIDPGSKDCKTLLNIFNSLGLMPEYILLTHEHFDHIWGCNYLINEFDSRLICSQICKEKIGVPQNYYNKLYFNDQTFYSISEVYKTIEELDAVFLFDGMSFSFVKTPGHSSSSICIETEKGLFTGDTFMNGYKPLILKRHEGSHVEFKKSVEMLINNYPHTTIIYPGHGEPFKLHEAINYYSKYFENRL